jgi:hypothetical protein
VGERPKTLTLYGVCCYLPQQRNPIPFLHENTYAHAMSEIMRLQIDFRQRRWNVS